MTFSISGIFMFYLAVFLAVVLIAWLLEIRRRRRYENAERRFLVCGFCGGDILLERPRMRLRCPCCGANQERQTLKEKVM
jgi:rubrerythrin